jgi:hypothetical protein
MKRLLTIPVALFLVGLFIVSVTGTATASSKYSCTYGKHGFYMGLTIQPREAGSVVCESFNHTFHGRRTSTPRHGFCTFAKEKNGISETVTIYADSTSQGKYLCETYHPSGWRRV